MSKKLGVRAVIINDSQLIMVEHVEKGHGAFYIFPGGGLEDQESIFDATVREVAEETNLVVIPEAIIYIRETRMGENMGVEFYVKCRLESGELNLGHDPEKDSQVLKSVSDVPLDKLQDIKWFPEELRGVLFNDVKIDTSAFRYLGVHDF
ncbi:MAG: NUDIX domain-containing protein [Candidatus Kapabacteria bacterium]|nr:NUDIX domain-containing protein [Candidatus Kapabacteria bacterium]